MYGIGETARASGLSISALRFYDRAGVLVPAMVDPATGYRWYTDDQLRAARLVAGLRRVGMPLADITRALDRLSDPAAVRLLLDAHLRRLEDGLADARRELSRVHALLTQPFAHPEEKPMTRITLTAADLVAALDAVRFAVGDDPELPMLSGVLIEVETDTVRLVATDRYRLAVAAASVVEIDGPPVTLVAPAHVIDEVRAQSAGAGTVVLTLTPDLVRFEGSGRTVEAKPVDPGFPDYRRALGTPSVTHRVTVDVPALRTSVLSAPAVSREHQGVVHDLVVLSVDPAGDLTLAAEDAWAADESRHVAVNRGFLLEALDAGGSGQLVLELDGPIKPLALRVPNDDRTFSVLMPVRL
jgi:DNA polymerase-3 subunit beta